MKNLCNLYKTEDFFKKYLIAKSEEKNSPIKKSTLRNYLSDIRLFLLWLMKETEIKENIKEVDIPSIIANTTPITIKEFIEYLIQSKTPESSIKRKLSSLRRFFSFCISQMWINNNPTKDISLNPLDIEKSFLIKDFSKYLKKEKKNSSKGHEKIKKDIEELLAIIS